MSKMQIGTLLRCAHMEERRLALYKEIGMDCIQIAGVYEEYLAPTEEARKASDDLMALLKKHGLQVPSMFLSYPNQDWKNPREGIGLVPEKTRVERMILSCRLMVWAHKYGIRSITCHVGFVPEKEDPAYAGFIADMKQLVKFAASFDQEFLFETGTEKVAGLKQTMDDINEPNLGINFDPANLLIYGNDDPSVLVDTLCDRIRVVHCKDARRALEGEIKGRETVLGEGQTRFAELVKRILASGFSGPLIIERELPPGPEQEKDIAQAVKLIQSIIQ